MKGRNIVCISASEWGGNYAKTIVEISKVLSVDNKVLYIDYPFTYKDLLQFILKGDFQSVGRITGFRPRLTKIVKPGEAELYLYVPPLVFPVNFLSNGWLYSWLSRTNGSILSKSILRVLKKLNMTEDLIHMNAFIPSFGEAMAGKLNEKILLYYCYDEINAAKWLQKHGGRHELNLMRICDGVITTSEGLFFRKKQFTKRCFLIKNAVNFNLFARGLSDRVGKNYKIVGYIGSIDERLDYQILEHLFKKFPDFTFEFVGRCNFPEGKRVLEKYGNVKLYGPRPVTELPGFIMRFSVGIIPFALSEFNKGIYPLKINEYLAGGLPVVMTNFAILDEFREVADIAKDHEEFGQLLSKAIDTDSYEKQQLRVMFAARNSWEQRAAEFSMVIQTIEKG